MVGQDGWLLWQILRLPLRWIQAWDGSTKRVMSVVAAAAAFPTLAKALVLWSGV